MARRSPVLGTAVLIALSIVLGACTKRDRSGGAVAKGSAPVDTTVGHAPPGVRIKVEVLNASNIRGAARIATFLLRERGYDVVAMGNAGRNQDSTIVLDRSNHPEWAALIGKAIGGTPTAKPDSSRYLDATVILGARWTPPPVSFHP